MSGGNTKGAIKTLISINGSGCTHDLDSMDGAVSRLTVNCDQSIWIEETVSGGNSKGSVNGEQNGGYCRVLRTVARQGDNAKMAIIELVRVAFGQMC